MADETMIVGIDLAVSHTGLALLAMDGTMVDWRLIVNKKKYEKVDKKRIILLRPRRGGKKNPEDKECYYAWRRSQLFGLVSQQIGKWDRAEFPEKPLLQANVEHYAHVVGSRSITGLAEIGGLVRYALFIGGVPYRETDPTSLKMFAAGKGNATKQDVVMATRDAWGKSKVNPPWLPLLDHDGGLLEWTNKAGDYSGPGTDLADAYWLAEMLRVELLVRRGITELKDLPDHRRRVFLRVTDAFKVNLLDRPFIEKEKDDED